MEQHKSETREAIAIMGLACRLPGARSPAEFWSLIEDGRQTISTVPENRWQLSDALFDNAGLPDVSHAWRGGFLEDIAGVDWRALRLHPREAKTMDPQHRLLLELAWEAMENAGYPVARAANSSTCRTGVFVGIQWNDYFRLLCRNWQKLDGYSVVGNDLLFASNRISFALNLPGPSQSVDCGCASGLVALQLGCHALWSGEAEQVLVGAVDLILAPDAQLAMAATGMLSKNGVCRPLDAGADGFVRGEGGVVLMLKPLSRVRSDERVHALIRGVAAVHGGRSDWIMSTPAKTQAEAIQNACRQAGIAPGELDYVELHGTGNLRGDAAEIEALAETVGKARGHGVEPCAIGSVKAQIGHLGPVAGLVGLLKVVLGMEHGQLPRSWEPTEENPALKLTESCLTPYRGGCAWIGSGSTPRRAGVTALSLGGVASHAVLEEAPETPPLDAKVLPEAFILPLSARSPEALADLAAAYLEALEQAVNEQVVTDLCYTAGCGRAHHNYRVVAVGRETADLIEDLRRQAAGLREHPPRSVPKAPPVFVGWALDSELFGQCAAAGLTVTDPERLSGGEPRLFILAGPGETERLHDLNIGEAEVEVFLLCRERPASLPLDFWAAAYLAGALPDFSVLLSGGRICTAPAYCWQRKPMWPQWLTPELIGTPPDFPVKGAPTVAFTSAEGELPIVQSGAIRADLASTRTAADRRWLIHGYALDLLTRVLQPGIDRTALESVCLADLGMDSIAATEIKAFAEQDISIKLPVASIFNAETINELTEQMFRRYETERLFEDAGDLSPSLPDTESENQQVWTI